MAMCSRVTPPFSTSVLSPDSSVVFTTAAVLLLQHFDVLFGGQQDAGWGEEQAFGGDEQQEDFGGDMTVSSLSVFSDAQQSSLVLPVQEDTGSALLELLLLPQALVPDSTGVDNVQHDVFGPGFAGADDEQHELFGFGATGSDGEPQESVGFCSSGAVEEQQDLNAFES